MSTGRGVSSFYSSSRDNDARSDVYTPTRQPQTRSPLQPLQMNRQARSGYLPGMGLADIASQEENFSQQDCFSSLQAERGRDDMFLLENTPPQGCLSQPSFRPAVSGESGIMSMLQRQQGVLEQVLQGQKTLQEQQERLEQRLESLEDQAAQATSSSDSTSCTKKKRIVTRELSVKVATVHSSLGKKFVTAELFSSIENKKVKVSIVKEVLQQPDCKFSEQEIGVAARRCFENLRRTYLEQQSGKERLVEEQAKRRKYRSRRERKFQRRTALVTPREMEKYWKHLSLNYMTEESDDPENPNGIVEHQLTWRSRKLDEFIATIDSRQDKKSPLPGLVAKKVRRVGEQSPSSAPADAPTWAVAIPALSDEASLDDGCVAAN